jgi:hypothetical protein
MKKAKRLKRPHKDALDLANDHWARCASSHYPINETTKEHVLTAFVEGFATARRLMGMGMGSEGKVKEARIISSSTGRSHAELVAWKDLGTKLRDQRLRAGLTLSELSGMAGLRLGFLLELEHGVADVNETQLHAACKVLGIDPPSLPGRGKSKQS